jgi:hypothetical protein
LSEDASSVLRATIGGVSELPSVEFRPEDNRDALVRLSASPLNADGFGFLKVLVEAEGVRADWSALTYQGDGLDAFFHGLAADWRGWSGVRSWHAIEHGLSIEASHDGNRVELLFILRRDHYADGWQLRMPIRVAPGEALQDLARSTASVVSLM